MADNNKADELEKLIKDKKYGEAVDLVLGKEGSENDISGTNELGSMSAMGRQNLLKFFRDDLYGAPSAAKSLFNMAQSLAKQNKLASAQKPKNIVAEGTKATNDFNSINLDIPKNKNTDINSAIEQDFNETLKALRAIQNRSSDKTPFKPK